MSDEQPSSLPKKFKQMDSRIPIFVAEYIANGGNATAAAIKAGSPPKGATVAGGRLLRNALVQLEIEKSLRAQIGRINKRGDQVITELFRILSADIKDAFNEETGALLPIHQIPEDLRRAIAGFEVAEIWDWPDDDRTKPKVVVGELKKVKFWSKTESANLLGKHLKLWIEQTGLDASITFSDGDVEMELKITT